ncbi:unnamed protein product [Thelazia callipaeda]|uniref:P8 n=1 Tax=Thelazia callipaeda TaxID=103827 RepID=A0A0N5CMV3_THECL|nr:unnamed protein product [Thelazia callipaeda]
MGEMKDSAKQEDNGNINSNRGIEDDNLMRDFANSRRTGRRNAVPEVDTRGIDPDAVKLAKRLSTMNTDSRNGMSFSSLIS